MAARIRYLRGIEAAATSAREGYLRGVGEDLLTDDELESLRVCANEMDAKLWAARRMPAKLPLVKRNRLVAYVYREPVEPVPYVPPVYEPIEEPIFKETTK
jgi:hypothetical protein